MEVNYEGKALPAMDRLAHLNKAQERMALRRHTIQVGPGRRNVLVEHRRIDQNAYRNHQRAEVGRYEW